jgi:hypothetical protein
VLEGRRVLPLSPTSLPNVEIVSQQPDSAGLYAFSYLPLALGRWPARWNHPGGLAEVRGVSMGTALAPLKVGCRPHLNTAFRLVQKRGLYVTDHNSA